jgi:hypothetical protein
MHLHSFVGQVPRRRALVGTAATLAGAALAHSLSQTATADGPHSLPRQLPAPKPIPGGTQIPNGPLLHVFLPGPPNITLPFTGLTLEGLNVEPSTITDFNGFTALAYIVGSARGSDGRNYDLEVDLRVFEGRYVGETGARSEGTFAMI